MHCLDKVIHTYCFSLVGFTFKILCKGKKDFKQPGWKKDVIKLITMKKKKVV